MRRLEILIGLMLLSINIFGQQLVLDSLVNKVIRVSPKLKMLNAKAAVSESKIVQNSNLPDPMLTLGLMNLPTNSFSFTQEPMTGKIVGLSQAFPFPGKLSAAEKVQSKDVDINQQEIDDAKNEIANDVRKAYYDLRFSREALSVAYKSQTLLKQIADVVKTKYEVSRASQQNLIQVDVELTKMQDKIEELKGKESANLAVLNSYLLQDPSTPIETNEIPLIEKTEFTISELDSLAKSHRPFLKGIQEVENKAALMKNLSEYDFYPNFNVSVQYSQRDKIAATNTPLHDFLSFMVGISLPLNYGGKVSAKVQEQGLMQKMYSDQYDAAFQFLNKNFGQSLAKLKELKEREKLIREGLLPQAEQFYHAAMSSYQVGDTDFINVIDAQDKLYTIETNLYNIRTMYFKELSQLDFLTGTKIYNY